jgi:hypothetical protein
MTTTAVVVIGVATAMATATVAEATTSATVHLLVGALSHWTMVGGGGGGELELQGVEEFGGHGR